MAAESLEMIDPATIPQVNQLLLEALDERWKNYGDELKRCRAEFSNEAVHDLRASARRMLAVIQLLNSTGPRRRLERLNRAFREQLEEFDGLRDVQVVLAELSETRQELPQLQEFEAYFQEMEKGLLKTLRKKLRIIDLFEVAKRIRRTRESLKTESSARLRTQTLQAVDGEFLVTRRRRDWITQSQAASIHRVRSAFKSFRYMVEVVHPLLPDFPLENLERMNDYQSRMGEIQDVEVIMQMLADAPVNVSSFDPEPVRRYYERCFTEAVLAYLQCMDELDTFWRPAPDQPFPWEK